MNNPYSPPDTSALEQETAIVRPSAALALLLSLVTTGGGYYYAGARWRLVGLAVLVPVVLLCVAISIWAGLPPFLYVAYVLLVPLVWADSFRQARRPDARRPPWPELFGAILLCLVYFRGTAMLFRTFVLEPFRLPAASMAPTLLTNDFFLTDKLAYIVGEPQRGDIAVFKFPDDPGVNYVKRVVGVPGDVVTIGIDGRIEINGAILAQQNGGSYLTDGREASLLREELGPERSYLILSLPGPRFRTTPQTWEVPADAYFMLGDNRDNSKDSRYWRKTFVPRDDMLGRAIYRYWSSDPETGWPRFERIGAIPERVDLPTETPPPAGP